MSLSQAVKLARVELAGLSGRQRITRFSQIARLFASEVAGTLALAPFALRASQVYSRLQQKQPPLDAAAAAASAAPSDGSRQQEGLEAEDGVSLFKAIRYGPEPRQTLDVYQPADASAAAASQAAAAAGHRQLPVVVFVHGGVWAAGEAWHYAPLAASLARLGIVTVVLQYSLYPDALVPQIVQEVSAAFDWVMANVGSYGGDPHLVSLVGHSAGAQLCMMALLQRAQAAHDAAAAQHKGTQHHHQRQQQRQRQRQPPHAMPRQFVGITGVFDIARHYSFEKERGVHSLSTMLPAMGGDTKHFAAQSPSVILAAALAHQQQQQEPRTAAGLTKAPQQPGQDGELPACSFYSSFQLAGEAISHRIGFDRGSEHYAAAEAGLVLQSLEGMEDVPQFDLAAASYLPPTVLMSSCTDMTVPWYESSELYWRLYDCGVPVKHLVYNKVGHGDFVTAWAQSAPSANGGGGGGEHGQAPAGGPTAAAARHARWLQQLPPYCRDLAIVVRGEAPVRFVERPSSSSSSQASRSNGNGAARPARQHASAEEEAADATVLLQSDLN